MGGSRRANPGLLAPLIVAPHSLPPCRKPGQLIPAHPRPGWHGQAGIKGKTAQSRDERLSLAIAHGAACITSAHHDRGLSHSQGPH